MFPQAGKHLQIALFCLVFFNYKAQLYVKNFCFFVLVLIISIKIVYSIRVQIKNL